MKEYEKKEKVKEKDRKKSKSSSSYFEKSEGREDEVSTTKLVLSKVWGGEWSLKK